MDDTGANRNSWSLGDAEFEALVMACLAAADPRAELERRAGDRADLVAAAWEVMLEMGRLAQSGATADPRDPRPDDRATWPQLPGIELESLVGKGGQGFVFRGRQVYLDRPVAVKVLAAQWRTPAFLERFRREARLLAGLQHPHIVACHHAGVTDAGLCHLVMELLDGPDLGVWLRRHGRVPVPAALRMGRDLATALEHARQRGLVHRDVKPENVLLEPRTAAPGEAFAFVPKIADFGLARPLLRGRPGTMATPAGAIVGTPATMAPEQFDDPERVDHRADIYGLGCVLHHALTGEPAFQGTTITDLVLQKAARNGAATPLAMPGVPASIAALVSRMLARDASERPQTYAEVIGILEQAMAASAAPAAAPPRSRRVRWLAAGVVAAGIAVGAFALLQRGTPVTAAQVPPAGPALAIAAPDAVVEGAEVVLRAALDGAAASGWNWQQVDGPPLAAATADGPSWRARVPRGLAGAQVAVAATAATATGQVRREVRLQVDADPAAAPLAADALVPLFPAASDGEALLARWRCTDPTAFAPDESDRGACANARAGRVAATLVLPHCAFELRGRIEPRYRYDATGQQLPVASTGLRLLFAGDTAAALLVRPHGDRFRATFGRQVTAAEGWRDLGEARSCDGTFSVEHPLWFTVRWSGSVLEVHAGSAPQADVIEARIEPAAQWQLRWPPGELELHVERGVAVFTDWKLAAVR